MNQGQIKTEPENNYKEEIQKLKDKIIELQDLIIAKEKEIKKGTIYYVNLSTKLLEKNSKISSLESEILGMKAVMARQWKVPLAKVEEKLANDLKELGVS